MRLNPAFKIAPRLEVFASLFNVVFKINLFETLEIDLQFLIRSITFLLL